MKFELTNKELVNGKEMMNEMDVLFRSLSHRYIPGTLSEDNLDGLIKETALCSGISIEKTAEGLVISLDEDMVCEISNGFIMPLFVKAMDFVKYAKSICKGIVLDSQMFAKSFAKKWLRKPEELLSGTDRAFIEAYVTAKYFTQENLAKKSPEDILEEMSDVKQHLMALFLSERGLSTYSCRDSDGKIKGSKEVLKENFGIELIGEQIKQDK